MVDLLVHALREDEALSTNAEWRVLVCNTAANRIEELEAALQKIAQHDMQAVAMDALRPGERVREAKDD